MLDEREELFTIKGDVMDPLAAHAGIETGLRGVAFDMRLDGAKIECPIRWRDRLAIADLFEMDDHLLIHMYCPNCTGGLSIDSRKKRVRFDKSERRLDIEKMACPEPSCGWRVVVEGGVAQDV
jgi:hypothetical protein